MTQGRTSFRENNRTRTWPVMVPGLIPNGVLVGAGFHSRGVPSWRVDSDPGPMTTTGFGIPDVPEGDGFDRGFERVSLSSAVRSPVNPRIVEWNAIESPGEFCRVATGTFGPDGEEIILPFSVGADDLSNLQAGFHVRVSASVFSDAISGRETPIGGGFLVISPESLSADVDVPVEGIPLEPDLVAMLCAAELSSLYMVHAGGEGRALYGHVVLLPGWNMEIFSSGNDIRICPRPGGGLGVHDHGFNPVLDLHPEHADAIVSADPRMDPDHPEAYVPSNPSGSARLESVNSVPPLANGSFVVAGSSPIQVVSEDIQEPDPLNRIVISLELDHLSGNDC